MIKFQTILKNNLHSDNYPISKNIQLINDLPVWIPFDFSIGEHQHLVAKEQRALELPFALVSVA